MVTRALSTMAEDINAIAREHGFWDQPRQFSEVVALIHSEVSEALEEERGGRPYVYVPVHHCGKTEPADLCFDERCKPEGAAIELLDVIIRVLDWFGDVNFLNPDLLADWKIRYNDGRPYKHGKKF